MKNKSPRLSLSGSLRLSPAHRRLKSTPARKQLQFFAHLKASAELLPTLALAVKNGLASPLDATQLAIIGHVPNQVLHQVSKGFSDAGFEVGSFDPLSGLLPIKGSAGLLRKHLGCTLNEYLGDDGIPYTGRRGTLSLPAQWGIGGFIKGIHGIDQRPKARPHYRKATGSGSDPSQEALGRSWSARAAAEHYGVPLNKLGAGFCVGFVSLGGGLEPAVVAKANKRLGLPEPKITIITVDGAANSPSGSLDGADGENYLDAQCQAGVAPLAEQIMSIGPNTVTGFANALLALARHEKKPSKISISWGAREDGEWTESDRALFDSALQTCMAMGITVFCAAGDDGSTDGASDGKAHCDYPASSPWNTACSGVYDNGSVVRAWKSLFGGATGGGVSGFYREYTGDQVLLQEAGVALPVHADTGKPGRVVGDIAGIADPATGIEVYSPGGSITAIGGTSAVSPFHAAAFVALESALGTRVPDVNALLYKLAAGSKNVCMPVTKGNNGHYACKTGDIFNAVCGLGPVDYARLFDTLKQKN